MIKSVFIALHKVLLHSQFTQVSCALTHFYILLTSLQITGRQPSRLGQFTGLIAYCTLHILLSLSRYHHQLIFLPSHSDGNCSMIHVNINKWIFVCTHMHRLRRSPITKSHHYLFMTTTCMLCLLFSFIKHFHVTLKLNGHFGFTYPFKGFFFLNIHASLLGHIKAQLS